MPEVFHNISNNKWIFGVVRDVIAKMHRICEQKTSNNMENKNMSQI